MCMYPMWDELSKDIKQIVYRYISDHYYGEVMGQYHQVWVNQYLDNSNEPAYYWDEKESMFYVLGYDENGNFDKKSVYGANYRKVGDPNMYSYHIYKFHGSNGYYNLRLPPHYQYSLLKCEEINQLMGV